MDKTEFYKGIYKAVLRHCYKHVGDLNWQYFITQNRNYKYYRTKLENLPVIVGFNLETQQYFLALAKVGDIGNTNHRKWWFPTKLQRLFVVLQQLEKKVNYVKKGQEEKAGS